MPSQSESSEPDVISRPYATRVGKITFDVPQVRKGPFYPDALERGIRSERALKLALAEMYVQGVSTRKVAAITEQLCGFEVSSTQVSQATAPTLESLELVAACLSDLPRVAS